MLSLVGPLLLGQVFINIQPGGGRQGKEGKKKTRQSGRREGSRRKGRKRRKRKMNSKEKCLIINFFTLFVWRMSFSGIMVSIFQALSYLKYFSELMVALIILRKRILSL